MEASNKKKITETEAREVIRYYIKEILRQSASDCPSTFSEAMSFCHAITSLDHGRRFILSANERQALEELWKSGGKSI